MQCKGEAVYQEKKNVYNEERGKERIQFVIFVTSLQDSAMYGRGCVPRKGVWEWLVIQEKCAK